jgi:hypothetical protein
MSDHMLIPALCDRVYKGLQCMLTVVSSLFALHSPCPHLVLPCLPKTLVVDHTRTHHLPLALKD